MTDIVFVGLGFVCFALGAGLLWGCERLMPRETARPGEHGSHTTDNLGAKETRA